MAAPGEYRVLSPGEFGTALQEFLNASLALAPVEEPELRRRLREHLGTDALEALPVLSREHERHEHPNLQAALDHLLAQPGWSAEVVGLRKGHPHMESGGLAEILLAPAAGRVHYGNMPTPGPLEYDTVTLDVDERVACLASALLLIAHGERRLAALIGRGERMMGGSALRFEVVATEREEGERLLAELERLMLERNVYRGRVLAFARTREGGLALNVRRLPEVAREDIVLAAGVLERVERHALGPVRHRERLLAAGRHLKRGLLLHGPPGTGKTLTVMHLAARMPGRTTIILTGQALGLIEPACALARDLAPSTVVLEDVDLVARERHYDPDSAPVLFTLLNEMDGLAADADVLFVLTTNRPDALEPALAARPGRIDQALELGLPDADGRRRLLELYARGLTVRATGLDAVVERLEGASPAHVKELLRKAALLAAEEGEGELVVEDRHLEGALDDLVLSSAEVKANVFGEASAEDAFPFPVWEGPDDFG